MSIAEYLSALEEFGATAACLTNHGDMGDFDEMAAAAPEGLAVIPGVEVSSAEGDFIVFSADTGYLRSLEALQSLPARESRPVGTAIIWVHPFAGVPGGSGVSKEFIRHVARQVHGIEVYNGNWPDSEASERAREIAAAYDLAELGGSDAHRHRSLYRCWTEVEDTICSPRDLVEAIKTRATIAAEAAGGRSNTLPRSW